MTIKARMLSITGAAIIALGLASGVNAGDPATDTADVEVRVSAPEGGALRWTIAGSEQFTAVTGSLDAEGSSHGGLLLSVEDTRFTRAGWSLSISATDFTGQETGDTIGVGNFLIAPGTVDVLAGDSGLDPVPGSFALSTDGQVLLAAPLGSGSGRYALPLSGTVTIPANTAADTYVSTITVDETSAP